MAKTAPPKRFRTPKKETATESATASVETRSETGRTCLVGTCSCENGTRSMTMRIPTSDRVEFNAMMVYCNECKTTFNLLRTA